MILFNFSYIASGVLLLLGQQQRWLEQEESREIAVTSRAISAYDSGIMQDSQTYFHSELKNEAPAQRKVKIGRRSQHGLSAKAKFKIQKEYRKEMRKQNANFLKTSRKKRATACSIPSPRPASCMEIPRNNPLECPQLFDIRNSWAHFATPFNKSEYSSRTRAIFLGEFGSCSSTLASFRINQTFLTCEQNTTGTLLTTFNSLGPDHATPGEFAKGTAFLSASADTISFSTCNELGTYLNTSASCIQGLCCETCTTPAPATCPTTTACPACPTCPTVTTTACPTVTSTACPTETTTACAPCPTCPTPTPCPTVSEMPSSTCPIVTCPTVTCPTTQITTIKVDNATVNASNSSADSFPCACNQEVGIWDRLAGLWGAIIGVGSLGIGMAAGYGLGSACKVPATTSSSAVTSSNTVSGVKRFISLDPDVNL